MLRLIPRLFEVFWRGIWMKQNRPSIEPDIQRPTDLRQHQHSDGRRHDLRTGFAPDPEDSPNRHRSPPPAWAFPPSSPSENPDVGSDGAESESRRTPHMRRGELTRLEDEASRLLDCSKVEQTWTKKCHEWLGNVRQPFQVSHQSRLNVYACDCLRKPTSPAIHSTTWLKLNPILWEPFAAPHN